ncbi:MAG: hypothetical protein PHF18_09725 [Methanosarcina sp.]|nr:hypothetical protein [Methanosarcina sp.]
MKLLKTHYFDAVAICCRDDQKVEVEDSVFLKRNVPAGDYQQRRGKRSEREEIREENTYRKAFWAQEIRSCKNGKRDRVHSWQTVIRFLYFV